MRSLRHEEEDLGEVVHVPAGKGMVIRAGDLSIDSERSRTPRALRAEGATPRVAYDRERTPVRCERRRRSTG